MAFFRGSSSANKAVKGTSIVGFADASAYRTLFSTQGGVEVREPTDHYPTHAQHVHTHVPATVQPKPKHKSSKWKAAGSAEDKLTVHPARLAIFVL